MVKVFFKGIGYAERYLEEIKAYLQRRLCVTQVGDVRECDVILVLCPIVSRAGTDVEAALSAIPSPKPTILMVFHRTFDPEDIIPNTQKYVEGRGITVDLLFNEEGGLLSCRRNEDSKRLAADYLNKHEALSPIYSNRFLNAILSQKGLIGCIAFAGVVIVCFAIVRKKDKIMLANSVNLPRLFTWTTLKIRVGKSTEI